MSDDETLRQRVIEELEALENWKAIEPYATKVASLVEEYGDIIDIIRTVLAVVGVFWGIHSKMEKAEHCSREGLIRKRLAGGSIPGGPAPGGPPSAWDSKAWYKITNAAKPGLALDVVNDGNQNTDGRVQMAAEGSFSGQNWQIRPSKTNPGTYKPLYHVAWSEQVPGRTWE